MTAALCFCNGITAALDLWTAARCFHNRSTAAPGHCVTAARVFNSSTLFCNSSTAARSYGST